MLKKVVIVLIIMVVALIITFKINKKEKIKSSDSNKISILLETEEGNIKTNSFPSKEEYEFDKMDCTNLSSNTNVTPSFNEDTWKLNLTASSTEKLDGSFECNIYFKEIEKEYATDTIIGKYNESNSEGLIKIDQPATSQTPSLTEYRYSGSNANVKNYVRFNNETWRIIGVFPTDDGNGNIENRIKIIRDESIGNYSWDSSSSAINYGDGINQWWPSGSYEGADAMRLLNPGYSGVNGSLYYNSGSGTCYSTINNGTKSCDFTSSGLSEEAKSMLDDVKWYTAAITNSQTTSNAYINERGTTVGLSDNGISIIKTYNWIGKVGLMYPSDYGYASSGCRNGEQTLYNYDNSTCRSTNWLYSSYYELLLSPYLDYSYYVRNVSFYGDVGGDYASRAYVLRPVTYLASSVKITGGNGTENDMYELSL